MTNSRYYLFPRFVAGMLVVAILLVVPVTVVAAPAEEAGLKERLFWWYDEGDFDIVPRAKQWLGFHDTGVVEGDMREVFPRIQFHSRFENHKPGGFFNELSFSRLPHVVYFRNEYSGLKGGRQYLQKLHIYDPEGNRVRSGNDYEFTVGYSQTSWNTWYYWDGEDIFTGPGEWRVESILVDRSDNRYLVSSRDLMIGE